VCPFPTNITQGVLFIVAAAVHRDFLAWKALIR